MFGAWYLTVFLISSYIYGRVRCDCHNYDDEELRPSDGTLSVAYRYRVCPPAEAGTIRVWHHHIATDT